MPGVIGNEQVLFSEYGVSICDDEKVLKVDGVGDLLGGPVVKAPSFRYMGRSFNH